MDYLAQTVELIELKLEQEEYQETISTMNRQLQLIGETVEGWNPSVLGDQNRVDEWTRQGIFDDGPQKRRIPSSCRM